MESLAPPTTWVRSLPELVSGALARGAGGGVQLLVGQLAQARAQLGQQLCGVDRSVGAVGRGGPSHELVHRPRDARGELARGGHAAVDVLVGHPQRVAAGKGLAAGEQLEEEQAEGVHVGACVDRVVLDLLGGEIGGSAPQQLRAGVATRHGDGPGQPEVGDLDPALAPVGEQDVLRLDVAVHQPAPVRLGEGLGDGQQQGHGPTGGHRGVLGDDVAQRRALDELHRQEDDLLVLTLVVDTDDVRVGQPRRSAGLGDEAPHEGVVVGQVRPHDLERDRAVQPEVPRAVDRGHPAPGELAHHLVTTVDDTVEEGGGRGGHAPSLRSAGAGGWDVGGHGMPRGRPQSVFWKCLMLRTYCRVSGKSPCWRTLARPW
nr:hypothetical protein [Serinicoccus profundi]